MKPGETTDEFMGTPTYMVCELVDFRCFLSFEVPGSVFGLRFSKSSCLWPSQPRLGQQHHLSSQHFLRHCLADLDWSCLRMAVQVQALPKSSHVMITSSSSSFRVETELLSFQAPEVFNMECGFPSDIWSAGVMLYWLLCGDFPFKVRGGRGRQGAPFALLAHSSCTSEISAN